MSPKQDLQRIVFFFLSFFSPPATPAATAVIRVCLSNSASFVVASDHIGNGNRCRAYRAPQAVCVVEINTMNLMSCCMFVEVKLI